uniref:Uncharacterized protein n=1 Tax=Acrobeloides nanus TaxID=290746 RepID=A0A914CAT7_9BILA
MNGENFDKILADLRQHVGNLQDKNVIADKLIIKTQNANQTFSKSKEYDEEVSEMNASWQSSNQNNLVANLQPENRSMISLQEENRQLKSSLEEVENALHLIMQKHRSLIVDFSRIDKLLSLMQMVEKQPSSSNGKIDEVKLIEFLHLMEERLRIAEDQFCNDAEIISRLNNESANLRKLLGVARTSKRINNGGDEVKNLQNGTSKSTLLEENGTSAKPSEPEAEAPSTLKKDSSGETVLTCIKKQVYEENCVVKKKEVDPEEDGLATNFVIRAT